jgi:hypothetical protein
MGPAKSKIDLETTRTTRFEKAKRGDEKAEALADRLLVACTFFWRFASRAPRCAAVERHLMKLFAIAIAEFRAAADFFSRRRPSIPAMTSLLAAPHGSNRRVERNRYVTANFSG